MEIKSFFQVFKIKDLREKILFVLFIFLIFRFLANVPIPGVQKENLTALLQQFQFLRYLNIFTGGTLERLSIVMLGVGPYIIAVVILQLLTMVFPSLKALYTEEGEEGRRKFEQYGRMITFPLAFFEGFGMVRFLQSKGVLPAMDPFVFFVCLVTIATGTVLLMWLGELISEKGIGEGISLLIFAGILADFPSNLAQLALGFEAERIPYYVLFFLLSLAIIVAVVTVNETRKQVPISYTKRVRGFRMYGGVQTYLPIPLNPAGVMPIIFALSVLNLPTTLGAIFSHTQFGAALNNFFNNPLYHSLFYFLFVVFFTFFYTWVVFEPKTIAESLQRAGGFVMGVRPGRETEKYLEKLLYRVLPLGALFLGFIAISPSIVQAFTKVMAFRFLVGGTSVLILVSVGLDFLKKINAELEMREYDTL